MATIDDFGGNTDPLNAPALGGASGWAAAVRDYLKDLMSRKVEKTGDTMTGALVVQRPDSGGGSSAVFSPAAGTALVQIIAPGTASALFRMLGSGQKLVYFMADSSRTQFLLGMSDQNSLRLHTYDDAGAFVATALTVDRLTGKITVASDPTAALGIATKQYADAIAANKVSKSGDTMTGSLRAPFFNADGKFVLFPPADDGEAGIYNGAVTALATIRVASPTMDAHAATKQYVDAIGTWQDYDPVVLQGNTVTYARTQARYTRIGNLVTVECRLEITSAGTASQAVTVSMPLPMATANGVPIGVGRVTIESKQLVSAVITEQGNQRVSFKHMPDTASNFGVGYGSGSSAALASGNQIVFTCTYETNAA